MDKADILQDISVELSKSIKKHLQHIKQLPSADKKQIEKLISTFKDGLDDLSEDVNESSVNENRTIKYPTSNGTVHVEIEEGAGGVFVDLIFNKTEISTTDIQFPTGEVSIKQKQKRVKLKESVNEAKIAFVNDKLVGDRIQKSGLLPLLGDNNVSLNPNKVKFTRELSDTLKKLYKKYSSLDVK